MAKLSEESLKASINKSRDYLVDNLNMDNIIDELRKENILTKTEYQHVQAEKIDDDKNRKFQDILEKKNADQLIEFLRIIESSHSRIAQKIKLRACLLDCWAKIEEIDEKDLRTMVQSFLPCLSTDDHTEMSAKTSHLEKLHCLREIIIKDEYYFVEFMRMLGEIDIELAGLAERLGELSGLDEFIACTDEQWLHNSPVRTITSKVKDRRTQSLYVRKRLDLFDINQTPEMRDILDEVRQVKASLQNSNENYITKMSIRGSLLISVSEYCNQNSIQKHLSEREGPFDESQVKEWIQWIATSLFELRRVLPFHGNLKPSNIFVDVRSKSARLIDIGIKSLLLHKHCRQCISTCPYVAPEVKKGDQISSASDVWSLGAIAYELLTRDHTNTISYLFSNGSPNCSVVTKDLVRNMLQENPASRPPASDVSMLLAKNFPFAASSSHSNRFETEEVLLHSQGYSNASVMGRGSFGVIFQVNRGSETLAAKVIDLQYPSIKGKENASRLACYEAHTLAVLMHPNIVRYDSYFLKQDYLAIIVELCTGGNLRDRIDNQKGTPFGSSLSLRWANEMIDALEYVHEKKVLHRDFKPENILLSEEETIKVGDFGVSTTLSSTVGIASTRVGTWEYMAPEVRNGEPYGIAADLWSLGVVLYEVFTLEIPPQNKFVTLTTQNIPDPMNGFIVGLLEKNPSRRPMCKQYRKQNLESSHDQVSSGGKRQVQDVLEVDACMSTSGHTKKPKHSTAKEEELESSSLTLTQEEKELIKEWEETKFLKWKKDWKSEADDWKMTSTILHYASKQGEVKLVEALLIRGDNIQATTKEGYTPLCIACAFGKVAVAKLLIQKGADVHHKDIDGQTPFHCACRNGKTDILTLLINNGTDVNSECNNGWTPLHSASWEGQTEVIKILLQNNVDKNIEDNNGKLPKDIVCGGAPERKSEAGAIRKLLVE